MDGAKRRELGGPIGAAAQIDRTALRWLGRGGLARAVRGSPSLTAFGYRRIAGTGHDADAGEQSRKPWYDKSPSHEPGIDV